MAVDRDYRVKGLRFRNPVGYTLGGAGRITLQTLEEHSVIEAEEGVHEILVPITLANDTIATGMSSTSLHFQCVGS